jgi:hypothetical protein
MSLQFKVAATFSVMPGSKVLCSSCNTLTDSPNPAPTCVIKCGGCGAEMLNLIHTTMHCDLHRICLWGASCREVCAKCLTEPKVSAITPRRDGGLFYVFQ